jgi:NADPH2:quinone reductase
MRFGHGLGVKRWGTAADRVSVAPDAIFAVPQGLDLASAAVCGASGGTAMRIFELAQANAGECVMVYGAGGNVGFMLTSLLSQAGVHVLGQVRDPAKAGMVERAGGEPLVASDASEIVRQLGGVNPVAIADPLGGAWTQAAVDAAAVGGRILNYGALAGPMTLDTRAFYRKGLILRGYSGLSEPEAHARCVGLALQAAADNRIEVQAILRTFRLARGAEAFEALRSGATGKVVVALNGAG